MIHPFAFVEKSYTQKQFVEKIQCLALK